MTRPLLLSVMAATAVASLAMPVAGESAESLPIFDAHVHYSHDAWEMLPPEVALDLVRKAGVKRALVSSSDDDGQQRLVRLAPDVFLPSLRPYRRRGEISTWVRDPSVIHYLEERLAKYRYVAVGEFHIYGADVDLAVPRRMIELARKHDLVLHSHSDADAIERQFMQWPQARILWAHAGFVSPADIRAMLRKHRNLWCDLAFRSEHGAGGKLDPDWRALMLEFPDRFMVGTDTFTPERWPFIVEHARWSRAWLSDLPPDVAERIAYRNGEALFAGALGK
ncbi:MAG TPA: amidohydrolase family protein [Burkholderiaceae bacterium]|nr:amidohydrolase family protein [Burkholderiaceae bacterium]